jgi:hypothetical protein
MAYRQHDEVRVAVNAPAPALFDHLDDQQRLAAHMEKPSMMMMGGRMSYELDAAKGRAVGSVIRMGGSVLWLNLFVEEVIAERSLRSARLGRRAALPAFSSSAAIAWVSRFRPANRQPCCVCSSTTIIQTIPSDARWA